MNRVLWSLTLAGTVAFATPHAASGQTRIWDNFCTTTGFEACLSVEVSLVLVQAPVTNAWETAISVGIRNLQGTLGDPGAWGIQRIAISGLGTGPGLLPPGGAGTGTQFVSTGTPTFEGTAGTEGSSHTAGNSDPPTGPWSGLWSDKPESTTPGNVTRESQIGDGAFPIAGCSALTPIDGLYFFEPGYMHTCGDGWVVYTFMGAPLQFTDETVVSMSGKTDAGGRVNCTFGIDCQQVTLSATPEPATLALMGTGLVGVFGVQFRRRRRRSD